MEWYWYVIIGAGVVILAYLKLSVFKKMQEKKQQKKPTYKDDSED